MTTNAATAARIADAVNAIVASVATLMPSIWAAGRLSVEARIVRPRSVRVKNVNSPTVTTIAVPHTISSW